MIDCKAIAVIFTEQYGYSLGDSSYLLIALKTTTRYDPSHIYLINSLIAFMSLSQAVRSEISEAVAHDTLRLRAATPADRGFLREVFTSTRIAEFASSGLDEQAVQALLAEQFELQDAYYRRHYPAARFDLVIASGIAVGRLYHHWGSKELRIIDIALLPLYRGAGIGTRIMQALVGQAARDEMSATLYVEMVNPVKSLYTRLGFVKQGENGVYELMQRAVAPLNGAAASLEGL